MCDYRLRHRKYQAEINDGIAKNSGCSSCASSFVIAAYVHRRLSGGGWFKPAPSTCALPEPAPAKAGGASYEAIRNGAFIGFFVSSSIDDAAVPYVEIRC
jgi:hypothetical protein